MSRNREIAIRARGLSKVLDGRTVIGRIDLDLVEGRRVALLGANGAGKTTLLRCLACSLRPTSGEVLWFGTPANANPSTRRLIGVVGHESRLYPHLTLRENLVFAGRMCDVRRPARRADQLIEDVGLGIWADRLPGRVSPGMRQRIAIARALVHDPPILLFDEPFAGLDARGAEWLSGLFGDSAAPRRTILFATHDVQRARWLADDTLTLQSGRTHRLDHPATTSPCADLAAVRAA